MVEHAGHHEPAPRIQEPGRRCSDMFVDHQQDVGRDDVEAVTGAGGSVRHLVDVAVDDLDVDVVGGDVETSRLDGCRIDVGRGDVGCAEMVGGDGQHAGTRTEIEHPAAGRIRINRWRCAGECPTEEVEAEARCGVAAVSERRAGRHRKRERRRCRRDRHLDRLVADPPVVGRFDVGRHTVVRCESARLSGCLEPIEAGHDRRTLLEDSAGAQIPQGRDEHGVAVEEVRRLRDLGTRIDGEANQPRHPNSLRRARCRTIVVVSTPDSVVTGSGADSTTGRVELPVMAAIDMGTNSFHMVVARGASDGGFEVITTQKDMVRLGSGSGEMKQLTPDAMDRGIASLKRMLAVAASYDATVSAVATSAVREAHNQVEFLDRVRNETGLSVDVISGFEEARLIHLGVLQALPVFDKRILVVDIGGGSTEILVGEGDTIKAVRSVKLGSIRLTDRFFRSDSGDVADAVVASAPDRIEECRRYVRSVLAGAAHDLEPLGHEVAIGSSGTITAIGSLIAARRGDDPAFTNGLVFTVDELAGLTDRLVASTPAERLAMSGMDERRVDIIVGGALLLEAVFDMFGVEAMTVSAYALREGVLYDRLSAHQRGNTRLSDLRRSNALRLSQQLDPDSEHTEVCARLAVRLFDGTRSVHGLSDDDRELLDMAALVHNVGLSISHAAHHQHTYYIVRHSEQLTGFTDRELEILAQIARYHRRSHPSPRHDGFAALEADDRRRVSILAGLLRVAIGLDRGHQGSVGDVVVRVADRPPSSEHAPVRPNRPWLIIRPVAIDSGLDLDLEVYSAQERSALLSEALDLNVVVSPDSSPQQSSGD